MELARQAGPCVIAAHWLFGIWPSTLADELEAHLRERHRSVLSWVDRAGASRIDGAPELSLQYSRKLWTPVIEAGLQSGELRSKLTAAEIAHWIGLTELSLFNASQSFGLSDTECETYIDTFIIGALAPGENAS